MKDRKIVAFLLLMVYFFSCIMFLRDMNASKTGQETYESAVELATNPNISLRTLSAGEHQSVGNENFIENDPNAEFLLSLDIQSLKDVNPDVIGWIYIPGTNISYPLMQGEDNEYYLDHTWDNQTNYMGSIFLESTASADLLDFNTILYGHNLKNKTMFSHLHKYKDPAHYAQYPYVYIATEAGVYRYHIFAAFEVPTTASTYRIRFKDQEQMQVFLTDNLARNTLETDITPTIDDRILTMSTCTGVIKSNRWVIQAVFEGQLILHQESAAKQEQILHDTATP